MIAIIGKSCVGKTFLLNKAKSLGYSILNCDDFFAKQYEYGNECYKLIETNFGKKYVNGSNVDKKILKNIMLNENNRDFLEKLIYPILFKHLEKNIYDFVEIPILYSKNCDFTIFFKKTWNIVSSLKTRKKNANFRNVDNYDFIFFNLINNGFYKSDVVDIYMDKLPDNINWKLFFKTGYI